MVDVIVDIYRRFVMKRTILNAVTVLIVSLLVPFSVIAENADKEPIMSENFDNYTGGMIEGWDKVSGHTRCSVANFGDGHGNCLAIKSSETSSITARYRFDKTYTETNIYYISFYTRCDMPEGGVILSLLDEENNPYRTIKLGEDVQIYTGDGATSFTKIICSEYKSDAWYKFDIWMDMERDKISYVMTDKFGNTYDYATNCSDIEAFRAISISQMSKQNTVYYDDIKVEIATRGNIEKWVEEGVKVPVEIVNSFKVIVSSDHIGNIFFDEEEAVLYTDIKNRDEKQNTKTIHFEVKNVDHRVVWSSDEEITLGAGEEIRIIIKPELNKYGTYLLEVTENGDMLCYEHLSRSVKNTELNTRLGLSTHTTREGTDIRVLDLQAAAGFGKARENFRWNEDEEGNIADTTIPAEDFLNHCMELGIEPYALMRVECSPKYDNPDGGFTTSDEALAGVEEYYRLIAEKSKGKMQYFSAWCELYFIKNPDGTVGDGADYAKILKAAYKGLKAGNPDAKLIAFNDFIGKSVSRVTYRQALDAMKAEGTYYFDVFGTHPYHSSQAPEVKEYWDENTSWIDLDTYLDEMVTEYGIEDMMRWANEVGYYAWDYDDEKAAAYSIRMMLLNDALDSYDVMNVHSLQDIYLTDDGLGLLRHWRGLDTPHSAKPQYIAYSWWNKLMNGAVFVDWTNTDDKYICNYTNDGKKITAIWDVSDSRDKVVIPAYGKNIKVYDMYGNVIDSAVMSRTIELEYTNEPIFVVEEAAEETEMKPLFGAINITDLWNSPLVYIAE